MTVITIRDVHKKFKVFYDKGATLKEKMLFRSRNRYEDRWVLRGIDFEVQKGEAIGLIGRNGCGKSTLLKLLTRIMYPDMGSIEIAGRVSSLIELGAGFHPDLSGRENIYTNASIFGLSRKEIDARMGDIVAFSELQEFLDNPVRTYSSGMYMRLAFSVAINVDADVLLIDEILAVGDANFQTKCFRKLRELKANGVTIVLVSHDMNTVASFCNRAIWLNDGCIAAQGSATQVVDKYLGFMNQQLYEAAHAQDEQSQRQDGEQGEPQQAEQKPEEPAQTPAEGPEQIDQSANRFGLRYVEITRAGFWNAAGEPTTVLRQGEPAEIRIYYRVNRPIGRYNFGMGLYTMDQACIYGVNTEMDGHRIEELPQDGYVAFAMDRVMLLSGRYILQAAIVDENGTPMDFYRNYQYFDVISSSKAIGMCMIEHNWILDRRG